MSSKGRPGIGQENFDGFMPPVSLVELDRQTSFSHIASLEYFNISLASLAGGDDPELQKEVEADYIGRHLFNTRAQFRIDSVVLNDGEYTNVLRSPLAYWQAAISSERRRREQDTNSDRVNDLAAEAANRSLRKRGDDMTNVFIGLNREASSLRRLNAEIRSINKAHISEAEMLVLATSARSTFANMISVMGIQRGLDKEKIKLLNKAHTVKLLTGAQSGKIKYWRQMTDLAIKYNSAKRNAIGERIEIVDAKLELSHPSENPDIYSSL